MTHLFVMDLSDFFFFLGGGGGYSLFIQNYMCIIYVPQIKPINISDSTQYFIKTKTNITNGIEV